jgi:hypothetical protein
MGEVTWASGQKIVESHHGVAFGQETIAHVRPNKTGGAGDGNAQIPSKPPILAKPAAFTKSSTCYSQN